MELGPDAGNRCGRKSGNGVVLERNHLRVLKTTIKMLLEILNWNVGRNSHSIVDIIELLINHDVADILQTRAKLLELKKCVTMASTRTSRAAALDILYLTHFVD